MVFHVYETKLKEKKTATPTCYKFFLETLASITRDQLSSLFFFMCNHISHFQMWIIVIKADNYLLILLLHLLSYIAIVILTSKITVPSRMKKTFNACSSYIVETCSGCNCCSSLVFKMFVPFYSSHGCLFLAISIITILPPAFNLFSPSLFKIPPIPSIPTGLLLSYWGELRRKRGESCVGDSDSIIRY